MNWKEKEMRLKNQQYEVCFTTKGGEIESFTNTDTGMQYMWQGDPQYWSGKNPSLFPIIGNTYDGTYSIDNVTYAMKNHGMIRNSTLHCVNNGEDTIVFAMDSDAHTLEQYPFHFHYEIAYVLENNKLTITYQITNTGTPDMPFTFGLHPGFCCPFVEGERFEDYTLTFSNFENMQQILFDPEKKTPYTTIDVNIQRIPCDYEAIERYATLVYKGAKSAYITLEGKQGHGVRMSIAGYPYLAIWTAKKNAPFLCIEPWYGHGDFSKVEDDFYKREGTMMLSSGHTFTTAYTIEVF